MPFLYISFIVVVLSRIISEIFPESSYMGLFAIYIRAQCSVNSRKRLFLRDKHQFLSLVSLIPRARLIQLALLKGILPSIMFTSIEIKEM
jgi:hypothetical protein